MVYWIRGNVRCAGWLISQPMHERHISWLLPLDVVMVYRIVKSKAPYRWKDILVGHWRVSYLWLWEPEAIEECQFEMLAIVFCVPLWLAHVWLEIYNGILCSVNLCTTEVQSASQVTAWNVSLSFSISSVQSCNDVILCHINWHSLDTSTATLLPIHKSQYCVPLYTTESPT